MKNVFDSGRRDYDQDDGFIKDIDYLDDEDPPTVCDPVEDDTNFGDVDMDEPGNKKAPANTVFGGPVEGSRRERRYLTMDEMSATADASSSSEASFVVDSVGDMPTTFKSAKQSSDVAQ